MTEDSVIVSFRWANVAVFADGKMQLVARSNESVHPKALFTLVSDLLAVQARRQVHEVFLSLQLSRKGKVLLVEPQLDKPGDPNWLGSPGTFENPWTWSGETATDNESKNGLLRRLESRLWRAAGRPMFDDTP